MTDMMMIIMKAVMEIEMKSEMAMGEKEKESGAIWMMTDMVEVVIHTVEMETVLVGILMNAMAEMVSGMMITGEEVEAMMTTLMAQEVEAQIGIKTVPLRMMVVIHLGKFAFF